MRYSNPLFKALRTVATLTAIVIGLGVALGLAWLGSNLFDERLTPAARALLAPRHDAVALSDNIFVALVGLDAPSGQSMIQAGGARIRTSQGRDRITRDPAVGAKYNGASQAGDLTFKGGMPSWLWRTSSIWQSAKKHRTEVVALIAANQELYQRYLGMHKLQGYFDSASPGSYAPDFLLPSEVQKLFLADAADRLQTGTPAQQQAALADLRRDIRMWKAVLDGHGGLLSKVMAATMLHADLLLLGDMVTDPDFHPMLLDDGLESVIAPFPLQDWKIGGTYGWEMRHSAALLEAIARTKTPSGGTGAPPVEWWRRADSRISARLFRLNATENLQADWMLQLSALADGNPGSFLERREAYRKWQAHEFAPRLSWYNPIGRALLAIAAGASYDDYPARVLDTAAFQRLVFLAYQIRRRGIGSKGVSAFMKQHPEWSTHPIDARPFYWKSANGTLGLQPVGHEERGMRFSLKLVDAAQQDPRLRRASANEGRKSPAIGRHPL